MNCFDFNQTLSCSSEALFPVMLRSDGGEQGDWKISLSEILLADVEESPLRKFALLVQR